MALWLWSIEFLQNIKESTSGPVFLLLSGREGCWCSWLHPQGKPGSASTFNPCYLCWHSGLVFCYFVIYLFTYLFIWDFIPLGFLPYQLLIPRITTLPLASLTLAMFECEKGRWWCAAHLRLILGKEVEVQWDTSHLLEVEDEEVFVWRPWTLLLPSVIFSAPLARVSQEKGEEKRFWNHGWFSAKPLHSWPWRRRVATKETLQD